MRKTLSTALLLAAPMLASALPMVGLTEDNRLAYFDSDAPGTILYSTGIFGLQAGERVLGIDTRPANTQLYALSSLGQILVISPQLGVVGRIGTGGININPAARYGVDFNPVVDRFRIIADDDSNQRANPDTGALVSVDAALSPAGDKVSTAYDRSTPTAPALSTQFVIDSTTDSLGRQGGIDGSPSPNTGLITEIGPLGVNISPVAGFDISPSGEVSASFVVGGQRGLYRINLTNGAATLVGAFPANLTIADITYVPRVPAPPVDIAVPTFSSWGLLTLLGGIALLGGWTMLRRQ